MRKIKLIKVVIPEIVAYLGQGPEIDNMYPDYRCPECGFGVADDYVACPHCGSELNWEKVRKPSKEFRKLINRL